MKRNFIAFICLISFLTPYTHAYNHNSLLSDSVSYDEPPYDIYYEDSSSHEYFHCNWGYGEENPSAYCLNVFEDPNGASFNRNKTIIYDILPDNQ